MQNWRKNRNFRKRENADGTFTYTIIADGEQVEVTEELYHEYAAFDRKMEYLEFDLKRDRVLQDKKGKTVRNEHGLQIFLPEREVSLDKLIDEDWDFPAPSSSPEEIFFSDGALEIEELHRCLALLDDDERALIQALYFDGLTERAYSLKTRIAQKTINDRKRRVIDKLKKYFEK